MKRTLLRIVSFLLVLGLCVPLAACSQRNIGGLGGLTLQNSGDGKDDDDIGVLGGSNGNSEPEDEPTSAPVNTPVPEPTEAITPAPVEERTPEPAEDTPTVPPAPEPLRTEVYDRDGIHMQIPKGWTVYTYPYDDGTGVYRLVLFVVDPEDANNHLFYVSMITPFFTSVEARDQFVSTVGYYDRAEGQKYEWSPVVNELSAEEVIKNWNTVFKAMQVTGFYYDTGSHFVDYTLQQVISVPEPMTTETGLAVSGVMSAVSVPNSTDLYVLDFLNAFERDPNAFSVGLPQYYNSLNNLGICVSGEKYDSYYSVMAECIKSLDITEFNRKHN